MIHKTNRVPRTVFAHVSEMVREDWRGMVLAAAWAADELTPELGDLAALRARIAALEGRTGDLDAPVMDAAAALFDAGVLLGFALARTWPANADGLDGWAAAAVALAGRPTIADAGPGATP